MNCSCGSYNILLLIITQKVDSQIVELAIVLTLDCDVLHTALNSMSETLIALLSIYHTRIHLSGPLLEHLGILLAQLSQHQRHAFLHYTRLLRGYFLHRNAHQISVVKADICHNAQQGNDYIGGI